MRLAGDGIEWGVTNQGPVDDPLQYYSSYNSIDTSFSCCVSCDEAVVPGIPEHAQVGCKQWAWTEA